MLSLSQPKNLLLRGLCLVVVASAVGPLGACGPGSAPEAPTYAADIQPLMTSHCVRCHGGGGTLNKDPLSTAAVYKNVPPNFGYFDRLEDQGTCVDADGSGTPICKRGLGFYAKVRTVLFRLYIHDKTSTRMPPDPAPPLTDYELQLLDNWLKNPV